MSRVSHGIDRVAVSFDDPNLVANAGLIFVGTLVLRLGLERLVDTTVRLGGRVGGARPGRKVLTLIHAIVPAAPTSITPTCCVRERARRCFPTG